MDLLSATRRHPYSFGWLNCHPHQWTFETARRPRTNMERGLMPLRNREKLLLIHMSTLDHARGQGKAMIKDGTLGTCYHVYDCRSLGSQGRAHRQDDVRVQETQTVEVTGAVPLEGSGSVYGWDEVRRARMSPMNPTAARMVSPLVQDYHPSMVPTLELDMMNSCIRQPRALVITMIPMTFKNLRTRADPYQISALCPRCLSQRLGARTSAERRFVIREGATPHDFVYPYHAPAPRFVHTGPGTTPINVISGMRTEVGVKKVQGCSVCGRNEGRFLPMSDPGC
ncbi:hypothetical protein PAXRUDRAFT_654736 [Paxillus rubicundulus Ve08.2h10]|uniref:Uncharacterized protein n=1 Tax=Paxillus rubicundulus Ve08.2h10 TaxID=930991 RepID=A0A0D0DJQ6_9AGAM|nr:hypothetical protein PAXRUDRAFT_654736 [Paxillus rubicundulus Ve08.2h10]